MVNVAMGGERIRMELRVGKTNVVVHGNHACYRCYCGCEKEQVEHRRAGRRQTQGRTKGAKIRQENNNNNGIKEKKGIDLFEIWPPLMGINLFS